jgi:hypothetical protein
MAGRRKEYCMSTEKEGTKACCKYADGIGPIVVKVILPGGT